MGEMEEAEKETLRFVREAAAFRLFRVGSQCYRLRGQPIGGMISK